MADDNTHPGNQRDRIKQLEGALIDAGKFAPERPERQQASVAMLVGMLRDHARAILKTCDEMEAAIAASEESARTAGDSLIEMLKRIK